MKKIIFTLLLLIGGHAIASNLKVRMSSPAIMNDGKTVAYLTIYQTDIIDEENKEYDLYAQFQFRINVPSGITFAQKDVDGEMVNDITLNASRFRGTSSFLTVSSAQIDKRLSIISSNISKDKTYYQTDAEGNVVEELLTIGLIADESTELGSYEISLSEVKFVHLDASANIPGETVTAALSVVEPGSIRTVLDENSTEVPAAAENANIQVYRTIKPNVWSTICLPFAMTEEQCKAAFGDDVQIADFVEHEIEEDDDENIVGIKVNFTDATEIEANHPYIIKVSSAISDFTVDNVNINPDEDGACIENDNGKTGTRRQVYSGFYGTYHAQTEIPNLCLYLSGNDFWYSTGLTKMKAFRAYFEFCDVLTGVEDEYGVKMFILHTDDEDGIEEVTTGNEQPTATIYDLQGRRVEKTGKGIYIINNKKVLVR